MYTEQRYHVRPYRYLVPDVSVIQGGRSKESIQTMPPLVWIEILSPEDRTIRVNAKVREVLAFGAPNVWVVDPETFEAEIYTPDGSSTVQGGVLRVIDSPIAVTLSDLDND